MTEYSVAVIPGDGIGLEVISAGVEVLKALEERDAGFKLNFKALFFHEI